MKTTPNEPFGVVITADGPGQNIGDLDVSALRELVWKERLLVLRGFQPFAGSDAFADYCELWGQVSIWPFGRVLELIEQANPADHIFDNNYVPLHWDGMYRPQVPEFQLFHCVDAPGHGQGGRTTFTDTVRVLEQAPEETRALWAKVTGNYQRKMEFYDSKTVSPIIDEHPFRGYQVIRYNEPPKEEGDFLNRPDLEFTGIADSERAEFLRSLNEALHAPTNFYAHTWQTGDVVVADNFSLLHGREAFESRAPRHIQRVHVLSNPPLDNPRLVSHA
ncbi:MAG: TauD/TfdA family dioxygenase [Candidatus Eremiobacteraeota bacterium]|nr:TauD/TfdA family dioxygenase [Candidatus Eremiobacteraeota bacterium]